MAHTIGIASDYLNFFQRLRRYLTGKFSVESEVADPGNTGDGFMKNLLSTDSTVAENWTVTCTTGGGDGVAVFSVTGSVSGAQASLTVGTEYSNDYLTMLMKDGPTNFAVSDEFTFSMVANSITAGQEWTELKYTPGINGSEAINNGMNVNPDGAEDAVYANELYLKAPGLSAADEIFINFNTFYDEPADYYNISFAGATGFETLDNFNNQPGKGSGASMALWQFQIPYWIVADGRRVIISCKVSTNYMSAYCGFILPYATPTEYPYPLYIGGPYAENTGIRWSNESHNHRSFFDPTYGYIYTIEGTWLLVRNKVSSSGNEVDQNTTNVWPYNSSNSQINVVRQSPGDVYPMLPMIIHTSSNGGNVYGELSGAFWCPGFANASENSITISSVEYVVFQDVYRSGNLDYCAIKMD